MSTATEQVTVFIPSYGIKIIGAIIILILGRIAAGIGRKGVRRVLEKTKTDPAIVGFVGGLIYVLILTFAVLAALAKFGIQTTSFVAVLGAAGFAIGFALQGSWEILRQASLSSCCDLLGWEITLKGEVWLERSKKLTYSQLCWPPRTT